MNLKNIHTINLLGKICIFILIVLFCIWIYIDFEKEASILTLVIIEISIIASLIAMNWIANIRAKIHLNEGKLKRFGKKVNFNSLSLIQLGPGLLMLLTSLFSANNPNQKVRLLLFSSILIFSGIQKRIRYYVEIKNNYISKLNLIHFKISKIRAIDYSENLIVIENHNKKMEIFLNELSGEEKQKLLNDLKQIEMTINFS
jgi:hypothetical protein